VEERIKRKKRSNYTIERKAYKYEGEKRENSTKILFTSRKRQLPMKWRQLQEKEKGTLYF